MAPRFPSARIVGLLLLLGAWMLWPAGTLAAPPRKPARPDDKRPGAVPVDPREQAKQLLQAGQVALSAQDFPTAAQSLFGAYRLAPSVGTLFSLGQLALAQGRTVEAQDLMRRFVRDTAEAEGSPVLREAKRILALPQPPGGEVSIAGERNAVVLVDDRPVGVLPLPLPLLLPLGQHRVVVERDLLRLEQEVTVLAGRTLELRCQFHPGVMVVTIPPALLVLVDAPGLGDKPAAQLEQDVAQAALKVRLAVLKQKDALLQSPKQADCVNTLSCQVELMTQNLVQNALLLKATLRPGSKSDWQLHSSVLDATVGDAAVELQKECSSCSGERVEELLAQLANEALGPGLARPHSMVEIDSNPPGAEVSAGDKRLGVTPLRRSYFTGALELSFKRDGYHKKSAGLTVEEGKVASLKLDLEPGSDVVAPPKLVMKTEILPRPRWRYVVGGAAMGLGVAMAGLGGSALSVDGHCVPDSFIGDNCQSLYMTSGVGSGLIVGGILLVGGGVVLLAVPGKRHTVLVPSSAAETGGGGGP